MLFVLRTTFPIPWSVTRHSSSPESTLQLMAKLLICKWTPGGQLSIEVINFTLLLGPTLRSEPECRTRENCGTGTLVAEFLARYIESLSRYLPLSGEELDR